MICSACMETEVNHDSGFCEECFKAMEEVPEEGIDFLLPTEKGEVLMKTYYMQTGILNEKDTVKAMGEKGVILATAGGFPVCPMNIIWRGTEVDMEEIKAMGVEVTEAANYVHSQEMEK